MPQSLSQKVVNTFVKGLITERTELTFPPDASIDELNCVLNRDGSRRRRRGARREFNYALSTFSVGKNTTFNTGTWLNVGGQAGLEFLVLQVGSYLRFYNKADLPYSEHQIAEFVNLNTYAISGGVGASNANCQFTSINGALVVSSKAIDTIYIRRDNTTGNLTVSRVNFKVRDFDWLGNKDNYTKETATPGDERKYDTANAGWTGTKGSAALTAYITATGKYPPLVLPWYAGKDSSGNFSVTEWQKIYAGTSLSGNGGFILDFFEKDRATASGVTGIVTEIEDSRFKAVASFSGRVFYAGLESEKNSGIILFSRQIENIKELGDCYQTNDPTSEDISDLLDTDGGSIRIPEAVNIKLLYSLGSSLYVFADNGVWSITGVDNVFRATEYSIRRITETGILTPESFVSAEGIPFWWSKVGIHTFQFDQATGLPTEVNLSLTTIQTFWNRIGNSRRLSVKATYDALNKRVYWAYPNENEPNENKINNFLILDIPLGAIYPWQISDQESNTNYILGMASYSGYGSDELVRDVVLSNGDDVVQGTDDIVSVRLSDFATGDPAIVLLIRDGATGSMTMGSFTRTDYLDWGEGDYSSYAVAGYDFISDVVRQKNSPYIVTYMRVTEEGWESTGSGYDVIHPSGLYVSAYWDFSNNPSSPAQQAYRYKQTPIVDTDNLDEFNYPSTVISSRLKLRGKGRSVRLKFESETGKDFILLGYGVINAVNQRF